MCYSIEPRNRIYIKGYGFLSFAKNVGKNMSNKYRQERLDSAKNFTADVIKTASKRAIQKTLGATGDLIIIVIKIAVKIASVSKSMTNALKTFENEMQIPKERCVSPEKLLMNQD